MYCEERRHYTKDMKTTISQQSYFLSNDSKIIVSLVRAKEDLGARLVDSGS